MARVTLRKLWPLVLDEIRGQVTPANYTTWIEPLQPVRYRRGELVVTGPMTTWTLPVLARALRTVAGASRVRARLHEDEDDDDDEERDHRRHPLQTAVAAQLALWGVVDVDTFLRSHDPARVEAAVAYIRSRRNVRNPGAYLRVVVGNERAIPAPIPWQEEEAVS